MSEENKEAIENQNPPETDTARVELEKLSAEIGKWKNEYLYLRADFDNYKKSVIKERDDLRKYASQNLLVELLEIYDNFERALSFEAKPENFQMLHQGVKMIGDEMKALFGRAGVVEMPAQGQKFDPNIHNALATEPTDKVPAGHISQVFKKPYKLHDRVIRPGQVIIAAEPAQANEPKS